MLRQHFLLLFCLMGLLLALAAACAGVLSPTSLEDSPAASDPGHDARLPDTGEATPALVPSPGEESPVASFTANLESGNAPVVVDFVSTSSGKFSSLEWDFGDGSSSTGLSPSHTYTIAGAYTVRLTVTGHGGADTAVIADLVTVRPGPPVSLEVSPSNVDLSVQETVAFKTVAHDEYQNEVTITPEWSVVHGGGSIAKDGRFTAGTLPGDFPNTVSASLRTPAGALVEAASTVRVSPGTIASIRLQPSEFTVEVASTLPIESEVLDAFGNHVIDAAVTLEATAGGTIGPDANFIAGTQAGFFPGALLVSAVKDTATVRVSSDVTIEAGPLSSLILNPSPTILRQGDRLQLAAMGFDQHGNIIPKLELVWEASPDLAVDQTGSVTIASVVPGDDLVSWWAGEGNADDDFGGNPGAQMGFARTTPAVVGYGFNLDGRDDYILIPDDGDLDITGNITVMFWAKRNEFNSAYALAKGGDRVGGEYVPTVFSFRFYSSQVLAMFEDTNEDLVTLRGTAPRDALFHHYAYVRDRLTHRLYVDGASVASGMFVNFPASTEGLPLVIGAIRSDWPHPRGYQYLFNGIIDEVIVFKRGLTDDEIKRIYEGTRPDVQSAVTVRASYKESQETAVVEVEIRN